MVTLPYSLNLAKVFSSLRTAEQKHSFAEMSGGVNGVQAGGWIGVDLDGTLAYYDGWRGPEHIGKPVPAMAKRVRAWIAEGRDVRIFTARASELEQVRFIHAWCEKHFGVRLPVTNIKDFGMAELWDDRCVQVQPNTGRIVSAFTRRDG